MANCYGTKEYEKYKREQLALGNEGRWTFQKEQNAHYKDYELKYVTYISSLKTNDNFVYNHAEITIRRRGKLIYCCDDVYESDVPFFYFYTINDTDYVIFRKDDLYGYAILNLDTLQEHGYFPDAVVKREQESVITVEAILWNEILLLFGCIWGGPYMYYALDTKTYKTFLLSNRNTDETETEILDDTLKLYFCDGDEPATQSFAYDDVIKTVRSSNSYDI